MIHLVPFRIGLDWLTINMSGPPRLLDYTNPQPWVGGRWWVPQDMRTRVMNKVFYLEDANGEKLLTVAGQPSSRAVGKPDWMQVQFANRTLYDGEFLELYYTLRAMGFMYKGISRMDLAADGIEGRGGDYMEPIQRAWDGTADYYGKAGWRPRMRGRGRVDGCELGTKASNKFFRVYNKSRELKTAVGAAKAGYIRAAWERALGIDPMDEGRDVMRFELQVKGKETRRYFPDEKPITNKDADTWMADLTSGDKLASMFASMAAPTFDFRTKAERARDARSVLRWDFSAVSTDLSMQERAKATLAISAASIKTTCKQMWRIHVMTNDPHWLGKVQELAHCAGLANWLDDRIPYWQKQLDRIKQQGDTDMITRIEQLRL